MTLRPLYFTVVFWGRVYREYFTDLLLASVLAPGNIPALNPARGTKFLIATTRDDWDAIHGHPLFQRLRAYVEPVLFELTIRPEEQTFTGKMRIMSRGQALMAARCYEDRACGMYLAPDAIFSDGSVAALERLVDAGKKLVLAAAVRFQYEEAIPELAREGYLVPGRSFTIGSRDLMRIVLRHLHSEALRFEYDAPWFADEPVGVFWWVPRGEGMLIHNFQWAPLIVDYGALPKHDTSTFENWTLDGDYIYRNFRDESDVYVVTDTDEVAYLSFTKETDLHFELTPYLAGKPKWFADWFKVRLVRWFRDLRMDPLKQRIFRMPAYFHYGTINGEWDRTRRRAARVIARVSRKPGIADAVRDSLAIRRGPELALRFVNYPWETPGNILWCGRYRRYLWQRAKEKIGLARGAARWDDGTWARPAPGLLNPIWTVRWTWRYRRFLWRRLKERAGVVRGHSRLDDGRDWVTPSFGMMNPIWSLRVIFRLTHWHWRYRRYMWQRFKEKTGLAQEYSRIDDGRDWVTPTLNLMNPWYSARWIWRHKVKATAGWIWRYRRYLWQRIKEKSGLAHGRSYIDDRDWMAPAMGWLNPIWSVRLLLTRRSGAAEVNRPSARVRRAGARGGDE